MSNEMMMKVKKTKTTEPQISIAARCSELTAESADATLINDKAATLKITAKLEPVSMATTKNRPRQPMGTPSS